MAADLVTRLLLQNADFDRQLKESKKQVENFEKGINVMKSSLGAVAATFGLAMGANEAFNRVISSSQTLGDKYASTMESVKRVTEEFFYAVGSGDLSTFTGGLRDLIDLAKEAYNAMDQLGNVNISSSYFDAKYGAAMAEAKLQAKNKTSTTEDREAGFAKWKQALSDQAGVNEAKSKALMDAILTTVRSKAGYKGLDVNFKDVENALAIDIATPERRTALKEMYAAQIDEFNKAYAEVVSRNSITTQQSGFGGITQETDRKKVNAEMKPLLATYKDAIIVNTLLNKATDEQLQQIASLGAQYANVERAQADLQREYYESLAEFRNSKKSGPTTATVKSTTAKAIYGEGSLGYLNQQLSDLQKQYTSATETSTRMAILSAIDSVNKDKKAIELEAELGNLKPLDSSMQKPKGKSVTDDLNNGNIKVKGVDPKAVSANLDYVDSISQIGHAMAGVTSIADEGAASWINYGTQVVSSIASAIPQIAALTVAQKAQASANMVALASGAGASVASIPIVGWIMAGAAIASVISAMAAIPKFAGGGIVPGSSYYGDRVPAMLNSGEMVLNASQQANLFRMIEGGSSGQMQAKVTVEGDKLAVLIDRVNAKRRRVR